MIFLFIVFSREVNWEFLFVVKHHGFSCLHIHLQAGLLCCFRELCFTFIVHVVACRKEG